jgi:hypothetical protein
MGMIMGKHNIMGKVYGYMDHGCLYLLWVMFCPSLYGYTYVMGVFYICIHNPLTRGLSSNTCQHFLNLFKTKLARTFSIEKIHIIHSTLGHYQGHAGKYLLCAFYCVLVDCF